MQRTSPGTFVYGVSSPAHRDSKTLKYGMVIVLLMAFLVACDQPAAPAAIPRETVADPTFSLSSEGGNLDITQENPIMVTTAQSVFIGTETAETTIFYTMDGSAPLPDSIRGNIDTSTATVDLDGRTPGALTIRAIAVKNGIISAAATARFTLTYPVTVDTPTFNLEGRNFSSTQSGRIPATTAQSVIIRTGTDAATIFYSTDGSDPTPDSAPGSAGTSTATVNFNGITPGALTIRAIAVKDGSTSAIATARFTLRYPDSTDIPTFRLGSGSEDLDITQSDPIPATTAQSVTIRTGTDAATIFYTTDGSDPSTSSVPGGPDASTATVNFNGIAPGALTIRAIAVKNGSTSAIATARFTLSYPDTAMTPTFSLGSGKRRSGHNSIRTHRGDHRAVGDHQDRNRGCNHLLQHGREPFRSLTAASGGTGTSTATVSLADIAPGELVIRAIAVKTGENNSVPASATFTLSFPQLAVTLDLNLPSGIVLTGGTLLTTQPVIITATPSAGVTIHYTTDGTMPTSSSASGREGRSARVSLQHPGDENYQGNRE